MCRVREPVLYSLRDRVLSEAWRVLVRLVSQEHCSPLFFQCHEEQNLKKHLMLNQNILACPQTLQDLKGQAILPWGGAATFSWWDQNYNSPGFNNLNSIHDGA